MKWWLLLEVLLTGERIRDYTEDRPFPSALFLGYVSGKPLHAVPACDEAGSRVFIITAYEPSSPKATASARRRNSARESRQSGESRSNRMKCVSSSATFER